MKLVEGSLVDQTEQIVAMDNDPALRNLFVTLGYHDLASAFVDMFGVENRNWCSFAIWASRTAGTFIRDDEVPRMFHGLLEASPHARGAMDKVNQGLHEVTPDAKLDHHSEGVFAHVRQALHDVQWNIMTGNKVVFAEIGEMFSRFVHTFKGVSSPDDTKLAAILDHYTTGDALPDEIVVQSDGTRQPVKRGGQGWLRGAIENYYKALYETDADAKAELMCLANCLTGLHEQTRLQTYIAASLDAPIEDMLLNGHKKAVADKVSGGLLERAHAVIDSVVAPLGKEVEKLWQEFSTVALMTLTLPDVTLRLGRDLPAPAGQPLYPPYLQTIQNQDLADCLRKFGVLEVDESKLSWGEKIHSVVEELLGLFGLESHELLGSGATDWTQLDQRMRYIIPLFRSRQADRNLEREPFSPEQRAVMFEGRIPEGPLV